MLPVRCRLAGYLLAQHGDGATQPVEVHLVLLGSGHRLLAVGQYRRVLLRQFLDAFLNVHDTFTAVVDALENVLLDIATNHPSLAIAARTELLSFCDRMSARNWRGDRDE